MRSVRCNVTYNNSVIGKARRKAECFFPPKCLWLSYGRVRSLSDDFFAYNATVVISYGLYYVYGVPPGRSLTFGKLYTVFLKLFTAPRYHHASSRKSLHGRSTANESSYAWEGRGYTATAAHAAATVSKCQAAPKTLRTQLQRLCRRRSARSSKDSAQRSDTRRGGREGVARRGGCAPSS